MSVVTGQARRRWAVMAAAVAVLLCLPVAAPAAATWAHGLGDDAQAMPAPRVLLERARASGAVPFSGLATSRGNLGLPNLPQVGDVAAALGGTTRTRIWWSAADRWRVDVLTPTGEQGIYNAGGRTFLWDYEQSQLTAIDGDQPQLRLPRADDLDPPQAARRLLAGVAGKDTVSAIRPRRWVAGVEAAGIRIRPGDRRSTIGHIDVWLDPVRGLPVAMSVVDATGVTALESEFTQLQLTAPASSVVRVPAAPGATHDVSEAPDLASRMDRFGILQLPDRLAGFNASDPVVGGTATYGKGLVRFVALPVYRRRSDPDQLVEAARASGAVSRLLPGGEALVISSGAVHLVVARAETTRTYVITGLVQPDILVRAAAELFATPPHFRGDPFA